MVAEKGEIWAGHMVHLFDMLSRVSVRLVFYTLKPYTVYSSLSQLRQPLTYFNYNSVTISQLHCVFQPNLWLNL